MQHPSTASTMTVPPRTAGRMGDAVAHSVADSVAESLGTGIRDERLAALRETLTLPTTARGFLLFFLALMLVTTGIVMQIFLSVQIRTTQVAIDEATASAKLIEQRNTELMWEIAEATSVEQVRRRALALGYRPIEEPRYMERPAVSSSLAPATESPAPDPGADRAIRSDEQTPSVQAAPSTTVTDRPLSPVPLVPEDAQWTSGLITRMRSDATDVIRSWLARRQ